MADMTQRGALAKDDNGASAGWKYKNITGQATTVVKSSPGILHAVIFNKPVATATVELDDALTNTTPVIGKVTVPASPMPVTLVYDVAFSTGLTVVTGVADEDITIAYI